MATDSTKQNPTGEVEPVNKEELGEETLEEINGGVVIGPFSDLVPRPMPDPEPDKPKDGGATGSW